MDDEAKAGYLKKKAAKGLQGFKQWKRRWIVLDGANLSWADSATSREKGRIDVDGAWLARLSDPAAARFEVGDDKELLALQGADATEARAWTDALIARRARRTSRWDDRLLGKVGASAGDRERLRAVCETWQDGHLTVLRERAPELGAALNDGAAEAAAAIAATAAAGADGTAAGSAAATPGHRLWCVLDRSTLWISSGPRTAGTPLGYIALDAVEAVRALPGQRCVVLASERGDTVTLTADTRRQLLDWNVALARSHSAARQLLRAQVLRRLDTAAEREPRAPPRPPPVSAAAAMTAERDARALAAGVPCGPDGRPLPGAVPDGGVLHVGVTPPVISATRAGAAFGACGVGTGCGGGGAHFEMQAQRMGGAVGMAGAGACGAAGVGGAADGGESVGAMASAAQRASASDAAGAAAEAAEEAAAFAEWEAEMASVRSGAHAQGVGVACAFWCARLPRLLLHAACLFCPRRMRTRTRRTLRTADAQVRTAGQRALHSAAEAAQAVDAKLLGGKGGTGVAAIGSAIHSLSEAADGADGGGAGGGGVSGADLVSRVVPVIERRGDGAELTIASARDALDHHVGHRAWLLVCAHRIPISNRWSKKVLGTRISAELEHELWAYARNLARLGAAHARATGQPMGGACGARVLRPPPRLASAAGAHAAGRPHAHVPLGHFLMLVHTLPLVLPSGQFFGFDALAAEVAAGGASGDFDAGAGGAGGGGAGGAGGAGVWAGGRDTCAELPPGASAAYAPPGALGGAGGAGGHGSDLAFVQPLIECADPTACKDAFFKAVGALQAALAPVHRARLAELDEAEATRIAAFVANAWQRVLDAGAGAPAGGTRVSVGVPDRL
ncbi:hypothetical protein KFE25_005271 [Diacronema lutheri]|uniref:PH domain-containing protein n=2 Tax=Diacronema lutheri TaxID=2081491 RepID=A0A8J6C2X6_DIALT|nr:hypothetical protein KFE25_005271 [Diacronema lutheri]